MALRNIIEEGDPILRKRSRKVEEVNDRIRMILDDMVETMREAEGVGLAAPQVGILRRMFVAEPEPGKVYYMIILRSQIKRVRRKAMKDVFQCRVIWVSWRDLKK